MAQLACLCLHLWKPIHINRTFEEKLGIYPLAIYNFFHFIGNYALQGKCFIDILINYNTSQTKVLISTWKFHTEPIGEKIRHISY